MTVAPSIWLSFPTDAVLYKDLGRACKPVERDACRARLQQLRGGLDSRR